jgi:hypothetical protein
VLSVICLQLLSTAKELGRLEGTGGMVLEVLPVGLRKERQ